MGFFATSVAFLIAGLGLLTAGYGYPFAPLRAPQTLVVVHMLALGWLSMLMWGALFQFVPVLVNAPLQGENTSLAVLGLLVVGTVLLVSGFAHMAGTDYLSPVLLPAGAFLLCSGFSLGIYGIVLTILRASSVPVSAGFVVGGLAGLAMTATLGVAFTLGLSGMRLAEPVARITAVGVPIHAALGLVGWLTLTAAGVSYRLLSMFMLAPEVSQRRQKNVLTLGAIALAATMAGALVLFGGADATALFWSAGALTVAAVICYAGDMFEIYRTRKRRMLELNNQVAAAGLASLAFTTLFAMVAIVSGTLGDWLGALVFLYAMSWLTTLGLGKLYKIVSFLTWLEVFGPKLGMGETPRVQDLVHEHRARWWFAIYVTGTWIAGLSLIAAEHRLFRLACAAALLATMAIAVEIWRIRKLKDLRGKWRMLAVESPHLLSTSINRQQRQGVL
ncbi:hypothetical protein OF122_14150 [Pelagibacterium flavum]|uniref:Uncharacterized protein n=1 Tax=Pelagibacterium flavum TaxID=2984530 RepID=A0ABY6IKS8_9HYPH|nr:hypothetical protein [Pelagibacterium sp. YIM 151497]UYQ71183.1 hypothetical protein OF122_14150 [Pelagibacterium sp. YIM 151497]